ncbi:RNA binding protein [Penicillium sp. IBT 16267x]|nr:RNA binding protein [Penicillium sp. IBT 16267x]
MTRGASTACKVFYKGKSEDFIVYVDDLEILQKWKHDRSIPLSDVLNGWKILVSHSHGAQGILDTASKAALENEFGTKNEDEVMIKILEGGEYQPETTSGRFGSTNDSKGPAAIGR